MNTPRNRAPYPRRLRIVPPAPRPLRPPAPVQRRRRGRALFLVLLALTAIGLDAGLSAVSAWGDARAARAELARGIAVLSSTSVRADLPAALRDGATHFARASALFSRAERDLGPWARLGAYLGAVLPGPGHALAAAAPLLRLGAEASAAAADLSQAGQPILALMHSRSQTADHAVGAQADVLGPLNAALTASQPELRAADAHLARASEERALVDARALPGALSGSLGRFDRLAPRARQLIDLAVQLPGLLGAYGSRSYLVLYQDPGDVRANGGYIGTVSLLTLDHGRLAQIDYEDSKSLQVPRGHSLPPLDPIFYYEGYGSLELRDANYWPNFPTSARHIEAIYRLITGRPIDGVVAVQPEFVADMLRALGPLAVPKFHETVTAGNVVARMQYYTHQAPGVGINRHRKAFVVALSHALRAAALERGPGGVTRLVPALAHAFAHRAVQLSVDEPVAARALALAHWDGGLVLQPGDYLGIFDQNLSDSKLNPAIRQDIALSVIRRRDGALDETVRITYHNGMTHPAMWVARTTYQDYVRLATPLGITSPVQQGYDDTFWPADTEHGRLLTPGYLEVPGGATRTISASYTVPASALAGVDGYRLYLQKQVGSTAPHVHVQVADGGAHWAADLTLDGDRVLSTSWTAPSGALQIAAPATCLLSLPTAPSVC